MGGAMPPPLKFEEVLTVSANDKKNVNLFEDDKPEEEKKVINTTAVYDEDEDMEKPDDLKEGFTAEEDPRSKIYDPLAIQRGPAEDVVKKSLNEQLTALGRKTARKLSDQPKHKVMIPIKELNPNDSSVVVGINGWNLQIKRGVPVLLPEEVVKLLAGAGETPTIVR